VSKTGSDVGVEVLNAEGAGQVLLLCEHASRFIPSELGSLGLSDAHLSSHAVWDPGALELAKLLSSALDAPLIASTISRLVYDCNRPPEAQSAIPAKSELINVPGNQNLDDAERLRRAEIAYKPFCGAVDRLLEHRLRSGHATLIATIHSFTPIFFGETRKVEIGLLHDSDDRLANSMLAQAGQIAHRSVLRNEPYGPEDGVTHSLKLHAVSRGLANVMIEVRNDLLRTPSAIQQICDELMVMIAPALLDPKVGVSRA